MRCEGMFSIPMWCNYNESHFATHCFSLKLLSVCFNFYFVIATLKSKQNKKVQVVVSFISTHTFTMTSLYKRIYRDMNTCIFCSCIAHHMHANSFWHFERHPYICLWWLSNRNRKNKQGARILIAHICKLKYNSE